MKALLADNNPAGFRMVADSAFGRNGQPWFMPEFGTGWRWRVMLAVRIGRLGKCIAPKFARRYFDAMTLMFVPVCDAPEAPVLLGCMDGAAVCGNWLEISDELTVGDGPAIDFGSLGFEDFAALASNYVTLKTGDVLAIDLPGAQWREAAVNTRVTASLCGRDVLSFNIK